MDKIVAVIIPTFNRVELTNRAVNSVVSARPDLVEIIVVDDCGDQPYSSSCERNSSGILIKVLRSPFNGGPGLARKIGVRQFQGEAIAFLDSDDVFESGWLDSGLDAICNLDTQKRDLLIMVGKANNGTAINRICLDCLRVSPKHLTITLSRFTATMFNPFYTSGLIVSRELCLFDDSLKYCEDYYTNSMAIFRATKIIISSMFACTIARRPGSKGGLTGMKSKMFAGEMYVRRAMLGARDIPLPFKCLVPLGMLYQVGRTTLQWLIKR